MSDLWQSVRADRPPGVLWVDPDIAFDPDDLDAMSSAVAIEPRSMHTGWVKLWPASTGRPDWIWSHRGGELGNPVAHQGELERVAYVATGFLFTPAELLDLAAAELHLLRWEQVDVYLSEVALRHAIPIETVPGCYPKHLHF